MIYFFRFLVPVSMIICNDIMAYMFGFFFGKTPLIKLSPKKTWEGFIGGAFSTVIFGVIVRFLTIYIHSHILCLLFDFVGFSICSNIVWQYIIIVTHHCVTTPGTISSCYPSASVKLPFLWRSFLGREIQLKCRR